MAATDIQFVTVGNTRTAYIDVGQGEPVLLLHGWGANLELMQGLAKGLADEGFRVIVPDLPGFGQSDPPSETWTVHDYSRHVLALMEHFGLEQVYLFGHSFGGRLSIVLSSHYPERILKVVLCDAAGVKPSVPWYRSLPVTLYRALEGVIGDWGVVQSLRESYRARVGSADYQQAGALRETFLAVISEDLLPFAAEMPHPTLLIWGDRDEDTPLQQAKQLEQAIPDAGLVVFEGAGHYSYLDHPADTLRVVSYFFNNDG